MMLTMLILIICCSQVVSRILRGRRSTNKLRLIIVWQPQSVAMMLAITPSSFSNSLSVRALTFACDAT